MSADDYYGGKVPVETEQNQSKSKKHGGRATEDEQDKMEREIVKSLRGEINSKTDLRALVQAHLAHNKSEEGFLLRILNDR